MEKKDIITCLMKIKKRIKKRISKNYREAKKHASQTYFLFALLLIF